MLRLLTGQLPGVKFCRIHRVHIPVMETGAEVRMKKSASTRYPPDMMRSWQRSHGVSNIDVKLVYKSCVGEVVRNKQAQHAERGL